MSTLILPPEVEAGIQVDRAQALHKALFDYDRDLDLVFIKPSIPENELPAGAVPGRWHVRQHINLGAPRYAPITKPDGSFREPDYGVLEEWKARDMQARGGPTWKRKHDPVTDGPSKSEQLKDEQRLDEMMADYRAARRVPGENVHKRNWGKGGKKK